MKNVLTVAAIAALAGAANANIVVSEIHGSTTGTDAEYIEIYNDGSVTGNTPVDISGWSLTFYDSDTSDSDFGAIDFALTIPAGTILAPGDTFLAASPEARTVFGLPLSTFGFANNEIENDSYTAVFRDASSTILEVLFTEDPSEGPAQANIDGISTTPDVTFGPDGTFLAPGYYRTSSAGAFTLTDFGNGAPNNPGVANYLAVPAPGAFALAAVAGLASRRRRA